jgi:hypothetical protein
MYIVVKVTVEIESLKNHFLFSLLLKAFKSKSILRFNLNRYFYYNIHIVILITACKPDPSDHLYPSSKIGINFM